MTGIEHRFGHRAVEQPGVEVVQAIDRRHLLGDRPLARGRRSVDSDDHRHIQILSLAAERLFPGRGTARSNGGPRDSASTKNGFFSRMKSATANTGDINFKTCKARPRLLDSAAGCLS